MYFVRIHNYVHVYKKIKKFSECRYTIVCIHAYKLKVLKKGINYSTANYLTRSVITIFFYYDNIISQ